MQCLERQSAEMPQAFFKSCLSSQFAKTFPLPASPLGDDDNVFLFETSPHCTDMLSLFNEVIPDTDSPSSFPSAVILMYSLVYKIVEKYDLGVLNAWVKILFNNILKSTGIVICILWYFEFILLSDGSNWKFWTGSVPCFWCWQNAIFCQTWTFAFGKHKNWISKTGITIHHNTINKSLCFTFQSPTVENMWKLSEYQSKLSIQQHVGTF